MKMSTIITQLKDANYINEHQFTDISNIDDDIVGTSLFINILLSFGAFVASVLASIFVGSLFFFMLAEAFSEDLIWLFLGLISGLLITAGHFIYFANSLFRLRFSAWFMIFGKFALLGLIFERLASMVGYDIFANSAIYYLPLGLLFAFANMKIAKTKLEIFFILFGCILAITFIQFSSGLFISINGFGYFGFAYWVNVAVWFVVILLLLKYDHRYQNRLPFYGFICAQLIYVYTMFTLPMGAGSSPNYQLNAATFSNVFYNLTLLAPSIYLILQLQKHHGYKFGWQYLVGLGILVIGCYLPIPSLYIILFCFLYGYSQRDRFILVIAYIFTPVFIFKLYHSLALTLDTASLLAFIVGIAMLVGYSIVKFTKFKRMEA